MRLSDSGPDSCLEQDSYGNNLRDTMHRHRPIRLLLVEDDRGIRNILATILSAEGFSVSLAAHGQEALDQLRSNALLPDLIILDLIMPFVDGWEFRTRQRSDPRLAEIPTLIMSACDGISADPLAVPREFMISKPVEIDELLERIDRCLSSILQSSGVLAATGS